MTAHALALDHIGVCARAAGPLHAAYEALGFTLTPLAQQVGLGTGNRCAMLRRGYIELLAILDPGLPDAGLAGLLARFAGAHILALSMDDAAANLARLRAGGLEHPGVALLERPSAGGIARFARLPWPDAPEGRLQLIHHATPELLWRPEWLDHPNNAVALEEVFVAGGMESAARLSRLCGLPLEPRPGGGLRLALPGGGALAILEDPLPGVVPPAWPSLVGFAIRTGDGNAAAARLPGLVPLADGALMVPPERAGGAALVFRP